MCYFSKKVRLFSQNDVLFLFYFLINPTMTTAIIYNPFFIGHCVGLGVGHHNKCGEQTFRWMQFAICS